MQLPRQTCGALVQVHKRGFSVVSNEQRKELRHVHLETQIITVPETIAVFKIRGFYSGKEVTPWSCPNKGICL